MLARVEVGRWKFWLGEIWLGQRRWKIGSFLGMKIITLPFLSSLKAFKLGVHIFLELQRAIGLGATVSPLFLPAMDFGEVVFGLPFFSRGLVFYW